ncbi:hypothetical protein JTE90_006733 [Oedothorax gibbosus]|uniref:Uncharacterized protein n=1 Tax=Oedothorax gibbosus TaxID=931172 RepID=A0AAV6U9B1_9ARAC|nr:hypothetical protein JTE90_006733 [Oedothorax gibbosus]
MDLLWYTFQTGQRRWEPQQLAGTALVYRNKMASTIRNKTMKFLGPFIFTNFPNDGRFPCLRGVAAILRPALKKVLTELKCIEFLSYIVISPDFFLSAAGLAPVEQNEVLADVKSFLPISVKITATKDVLKGCNLSLLWCHPNFIHFS